MDLDKQVFQQQFLIFKERIFVNSGREFKSFKEGLAYEREDYKRLLHKKALGCLYNSPMKPELIGNGDILGRLIQAIQIKKSNELPDGNNLVDWKGHWGPDSRAHQKLLDHDPGSAETKKLEAWIFGFFRSKLSDEEAFNEFCELAGRKYPLVAYLFFLKDQRKFMPVSPEIFDESFASLGLNLKTSNNCSWANYCLYNEALTAVQRSLAEIDGLGDVRLLDAHSFCFLLKTTQLKDPLPVLVRREPPSGYAGSSTTPVATPVGSMKQDGRLEPKTTETTSQPDSWDDVARDLVETTFNTVQNSNGQKVIVTKKVKEAWLGRVELKNHILYLREVQNSRCKLTGIEFQTDRSLFDKQLYPSLDRIDSDGPYSEENTQLVCRFINRWKSAKPDDQFRKLISLVRGGPYSVE